MARKKQYIEAEVLNKAMQLFWKNGYETTSMHMLEKEMNINKFSIYSSFGSKHNLFLECLKLYRKRNEGVFNKFVAGTNGIEDIKQFFYDSVRLCQMEGNQKGCLYTSTYNEFFESDDQEVMGQMDEFMGSLKNLFTEKLSMDTTKSKATISREANFLVLAKNGLATASRVNNDREISDYIEMTFQSI